MNFKEEIGLFDKCVKGKGLKQSGQRRDILRTFLMTEKHLTADDLFRFVKKRNPSIGVATVYITIKLVCDCGLGRELRLDNNSVRYEHLFNHDHHDHLYCNNCGELSEVVDKEIERLQKKMAKKAGFKMQGDRLIIYCLCKKCG